MTASISTSIAIVKTKYSPDYVKFVVYEENPSFASVKHDETWDGGVLQIAVQTEAPIGGGYSIAQAQANMGPGTYNDFQVSRIEDFGVARIKGQALRAVVKGPGAMLSLWSREVTGILLHVTRSAAINMWRTGTGSRGLISSGSTVASTAITLATIQDVSNFHLRPPPQASAAGRRTLFCAGAFAVSYAEINRVTGVPTIGTNWSTQINGLSTGDFLYRNGDAPNGSGTNLMVTGIQGWIVPNASRPVSATTFWTLNRSTDEVRLAGLYLDGTNTPMQEALIEMIAMITVEGGKVDRIWMHPRDRANFVKELGAKVLYTRTGVSAGDMGDVGFKSIEMTLEEAEVKIMADINVPRNTCLVTQWDTWSFNSCGPAPGLLEIGGQEVVVPNDDSLECRVGYYEISTTQRPCVHGFISNQASRP